MSRYTVRPLSDRTWLGTSGRFATPFQAKWTDTPHRPSTEKMLLEEVRHLKGRDLVLGMDISESDLKLNGELRAQARPATGAVEVAFESKHGPLLYRCDRFYATYREQGPDWWHNARAIALTLQALRAVDRYGATETGQQYAGFKALPAGRAMPASHMTADDARAVLEGLTGMPFAKVDVAAYVKTAKRVAHPDHRGGDRVLWDELEEALAVLGLAS